MNCPACEKTLEKMMIENISLDVCKGGCGGIWFDNFELMKIDEPDEYDAEALMDVEIDENIRVDHEAKRKCPVCENQLMLRHFFSVRRAVSVDECPRCGGVWLDYGELGQIRRQFSSEEEKTKAAGEYFQDVFGVELARMRAESAEKTEKARKIAHIFRFLCPSYYIPGKQDWGAF
jgi:Zn-finger nucleic acid-binding protein